MDTFFELIDGTILIDKKSFAIDLLKENSDFKPLITKNKPYYRQPEVKKLKGDPDIVEIKFTNATDIDLTKNYIEQFKNIKEKYKDKIKGSILIRITTISIHTSTVDLNGEAIKVY